jgi:hypothetical protein
MKSTYKVFVGTPEGNEQIAGPRYRGYDNIN